MPVTALQKALRTEPSNWVRDRETLPPENPAGHRKAYRRVAQMHHSHKYPQSGSIHGPSGEESTSDSIGTIPTSLKPGKAQACHRTGTEVIGGNTKGQQPEKACGFLLFPAAAIRTNVRINVLQPPHPAFGPQVEPPRSISCLLRSASEMPPDPGAASLPSGRSVLRSAASAFRIPSAQPRVGAESAVPVSIAR